MMIRMLKKVDPNWKVAPWRNDLKINEVSGQVSTTDEDSSLSHPSLATLWLCRVWKFQRLSTQIRLTFHQDDPNEILMILLRNVRKIFILRISSFSEASATSAQRIRLWMLHLLQRKDPAIVALRGMMRFEPNEL